MSSRVVLTAVLTALCCRAAGALIHDVAFWNYGYFAAYVCLVVAVPRRLTVVGPWLIAVVMDLCLNRWWGEYHITGENFAIFMAFIGIGALIIAGHLALAGGEPGRHIRARVLAPAAVLCAYPILASHVLQQGPRLSPLTLDMHLVAFDSALGEQWSFAIGRWAQAAPAFKALLVHSYGMLPIAVAVIYALLLRQGRGGDFLWLFMVAGLLGLASYWLFPASGPSYVFLERFPDHAPSQKLVRSLQLRPIAVADAPRNCVPSLHITWTLLLFWYSRGLHPAARGLALAFLLLTVLSTLGLGEHYVADLVIAVPFSLLVAAIFARRVAVQAGVRLRALLGGGGLFALWLGLLRWGHPLFWLSPAVGWGLIAVTLAVCIVWQRQLARVAQPLPSDHEDFLMAAKDGAQGP